MAVSAIDRTHLDQYEIRTELGISRERMAQIFNVSAKTIERWETRDQLPPSESNRKTLFRLAEIVELGETVYGKEGFRLFLKTPITVFDGATPLNMLVRGESERVFDILVQDYEGLGD